jgi:hypothetical protein
MDRETAQSISLASASELVCIPLEIFSGKFDRDLHTRTAGNGELKIAAR